MSATNMPYWRLSGFYWVYFASLGVIVPYWSLYLKSLNFDAQSIGELMAILMATKIVAPYLWSWIADHTGQGMKIIRLGSIGAALTFIGVFLDSGFWWLALVMLVFSFFWNATLPQFEANTMNHLGEKTHKYSEVRLWGSLGFVIAVIVIGALLDDFGYTLIPLSVFVLYVIIAVFSFYVSDAKPLQSSKDHDGSIINMLKQPYVIALLLICFLAQMSHGPYYTFYSIYLTQFGYSNNALGWLWALGVIAEIVMFMFMHRLMPYFGPRKLMLAALLLTTLRWLLIGFFVDMVGMVILAQLLHAASFGLYHAVAIELFHRNFKGKLQGRGQALYSAISFGAGGAVGTLLSGAYWDQYSAGVVFGAAALTSFIAFLITWKVSRLEPSKNSQ